MLTHIVVFWLKSSMTAAEHEAFLKALKALKDVDTVRGLHIGTPADTGERPIIDSSFTCMLSVTFDDKAGHDTYQAHALHVAFLEQFAPFFDRVIVYDAD